ncbi:UNVERIFIED_CONTAM: Ubiquitin-associated domain-containing protein 1 [Gekko kuhli]
MEMGFDEKEVVDALRVNNNQQNAACEWLLGDRKPTPEDLDKGIDPSSSLFQAILENPVVQLGLTNPKTLLEHGKQSRGGVKCYENEKASGWKSQSA